MVLLEKVPAGYENINTVTESFNFMSDIIVEKNIFDSEIAEIFNEADDNRQKKTVMDRIKDFLLSFKKWIMGVIKKISEFFKKILFKHKKDADELNKKSKSLKDEINDIIKDINDEREEAVKEILKEKIEIQSVRSYNLLDASRFVISPSVIDNFILIFSKKDISDYQLKENIDLKFDKIENEIIDRIKKDFDYNEKIFFNDLPDFNELKNNYLEKNMKVFNLDCYYDITIIEEQSAQAKDCIKNEDEIRNNILNNLESILKNIDKELKKIENNEYSIFAHKEGLPTLKKIGQYVSKAIEIENYKIQLNRYIVEMNLNSIKKYNAFAKVQIEKLKKYRNNDDEVTNESATLLTDNLSIVETHSKFIAECAYNDIIFENVLLEKDYTIDNKSNFKEKAINFFKGIKEFLKKYAFKFKNYILSFIHKLKIAKYTKTVTPNNKDLLAEFSRKEENIYKVTSYNYDYDIDSLFSDGYGSKNDKLLCGWFDKLHMDRNLEDFLIIGSKVEKLDYEEKTNIILDDLIHYFSNLERGDVSNMNMFLTFIKNKKGNFGKVNSFNSFINALKDFLNLPAHEKIDNSEDPTNTRIIIPYIKFCNDKYIMVSKSRILEDKIKILIQMLNNTTSQLGKLEMMISKAEKEYLSKAIDLDANISSNINSNIKYAFSIIGKLTQINTMISTTMTKQYYGEKVELEKMIAWKSRKDEEFVKFCEDKKKYKDKEDTK